MTARDDAMDSRLRAVAHDALAELGGAPGYSRDVPHARRLGSVRTVALAGGLAAAVGAASAAIGVGLHESGEHGNVPGPATSPTPTSVPSTPTPSATPVPGSLGNDLIYSNDVTDPTKDITTLTERDWTWAVRGHLTLPRAYAMQNIVASPHGSRVLLIDGSVTLYTDAQTRPQGIPTTLTAVSSAGQTSNVPMPSGLVLTAIPRWSDDDSVVCTSAGRPSGFTTSTNDLYVLKPGGAPRKMSVPVQGRATETLACGASTDTMVVELIPMVGPGAGSVQDEIYVARMSTGAVLRHFLLPKYDSNSQQTPPIVAASPDGTLLGVSLLAAANSKSTIQDSVSGRTLATLDVPIVNFFAGIDSMVVATDANGRSLLMEWQTGQQLQSDWFARQGIQANGFMFHPGHTEVLVESGGQISLVNASGQESKVSDSSYVVIVRSW